MLTLTACAVSTTGTPFPPGGGLDGHSVQVSSHSSSSSCSSSSSSSFQRCSQRQHSFRVLDDASEPAWMSTPTPSTIQQQPYQPPQQQAHQQRQSRKRTCDGSLCYPTPSTPGNMVTPLEREVSVNETPLQCPRPDIQRLSLPRKPCESMEVSLQETYNIIPQCLVEPNAVAKANFVECLVGESTIL